MGNLKNSNILWFSVSTLILAGLIYFSDYREIFDVLSSSSPFYITLSIVSGLTLLVIWATVWHRFFDIMGIDIKYPESFQLLLSGLFLNAMTPLGKFGGEPFVAHIVSRRTDSNYQQALSSISSADLSNAIPFATFGIVSVIYIAIFGVLKGLIADLAIVMISISLSAAVIVYLLWFNGAKKVAKILKGSNTLKLNFGRWQPYIDSGKERGKEILDRLEEVRNQPRKTLITLFISHLAVLGHIGAIYFGLLSVGFNPPLHTVFLIVSLSSVFTFSPTPGGAGTIETGIALLLLAFYPISLPTATSVAIIYRVAAYLPGVILGYITFVKLNRN